tara:strand:- start:187 stop:444 length:258 start_codon:yes stop_codon:yes gene_type:complete
MRVKILFIFVFIFIASIANANDEFFSIERCIKFKTNIEYLILSSDGQWEKLLANPSDKQKAIELSWTMNLVQNYSNVYEVFCKKK